jgi:hypothetical protein
VTVPDGPRRGRRTALLLEATTGVLVAVLAGWLALSGWRFYTVYLLPEARTIPTATPTAVPDPVAAREQARKMRLVLDHVGAGIALKATNQRQGAIEEFQQALALDPDNADARQNLVELGALPAAAAPPPATPTPPVLPTVTPRF